VSVVIHLNTLANPFAEAWLDAFDAAGVPALLLADVDPSEIALLPVQYRQRVVLMDARGRWSSDVENRLDGAPAAVFEWWGFGALSRRAPKERWPNARRVLCVDTYPNASRLVSEVREATRALPHLSGVDAFVVTSEEMRDSIRHRFPPLVSRASFHIVASPFAKKSHAQTSHHLLAPQPRLIFTGRSDHIGVASRNMAKDDVSTLLGGFLAAGARVFVQEPRSEAHRETLLRDGYDFYPHVERAGITSGTYAEMLSSFDGHIVAYAVTNNTLRRRVRSGLSTRYATALCSPSPMIVTADSTFAARFVADREIGVVHDRDPERTIESLSRVQAHAREAWWAGHDAWTAEAQTDQLRLAVGV
jgi:hypothetical protein